MKSVYKFTQLFLLLTFVISTASAEHNFADLTKQEYTKNIKKDFGIDANGKTGIHNKYGKVEIKTWDKNRVKIDVLIRVRANSESKAQEIFDRIHVDFMNTSGEVRATTRIEKGSKSSWDGGNADYNIDYQVFMPKSAGLDLSNKYGDALVMPLSSNAAVDVKYGNFTLEGIGGDLAIELGYGNGTVAYANNVNADISYSKFQIQKAANINFDTKYSKITLKEGANLNVDSSYDTYTMGQIDNLQNEGKYDNFEIQSVDNIVALSKYTDFRIGKITNSADFNLKYGGARFGEVAKGFGLIQLQGQYTDYKLAIEPGATYQLKATADYAGIKYPEKMNVNREREHGTSHQVEGYVGVEGARSIIKAQLDYGGLRVE